MTCNEAINRYMALDKHEPVPFTVTIHFLRCKKCRSLVRAMTEASAACKISKTYTADVDNLLMKKTMDRINSSMVNIQINRIEEHSLPKIRILPWLIIGVIMITGLAFIPFTQIGRWASNNFKLAFTIPFALIFAIIVSVYSALFVGRNLDFFVKKFETKNFPPNKHI